MSSYVIDACDAIDACMHVCDAIDAYDIFVIGDVIDTCDAIM